MTALHREAGRERNDAVLIQRPAYVRLHLRIDFTAAGPTGNLDAAAVGERTQLVSLSKADMALGCQVTSVFCAAGLEHHATRRTRLEPPRTAPGRCPVMWP